MTAEEKYVTLLSEHSLKDLDNNPNGPTGPFSAIAEHIDNACNCDVHATKIWIDKTKIGDMECLTFSDDGNRLRDKMQPMLRLFESGSMRLGRNVIILTKSENDRCVAMLSKTYLEEIGANNIIVPIISFNKEEENELSGRKEKWASLKKILKYSPFNTEEELLTELRAIEGPTGTKIIIWNLHRKSKGDMELDFTTENDIRIPCGDSDTSNTSHTVPESNTSLRAYCSILYLNPSLLINIRGQKVENRPILESLECGEIYSYKPDGVEDKISITFGRNKTMWHYGLMMYHKNRLIKAYNRVSCQPKAQNRNSIGVIGVIECDYLTPTDNKEDFVDNLSYKNTMQNVDTKLRTYSNKVPIEETEKRLLEAKEEEKQDLLVEINKLNLKVKQLKGEKDSLSEECKQYKARLTELQKGVEGLVNWKN